MKRLWFLLFLLGSIQTTFGQWGDQPMQEKPSWQDRMFFGGGLGLSFSQSYDFVAVSPIVGYRLTQKLATGFNFIYRYTK